MFRNKRFFIRRLKSGSLLMVRNNSPVGNRSHMTAFVSDDDGATWKGGLLLDQRESSYPDGIQAEDGTLFIIYDHQRYTLNRAGKRGVGSVVMAMFNEEDVRAGKPVTDKVRLHQVVTQLQDTDDTSGAPGNEDPTDNRDCRTVELPSLVTVISQPCSICVPELSNQ